MSKKLNIFLFFIENFKTLLKPVSLEYQLIFPLQLIDFEKKKSILENGRLEPNLQKYSYSRSMFTFPRVYKKYPKAGLLRCMHVWRVTIHIVNDFSPHIQFKFGMLEHLQQMLYLYFLEKKAHYSHSNKFFKQKTFPIYFWSCYSSSLNIENIVAIPNEFFYLKIFNNWIKNNYFSLLSSSFQSLCFTLKKCLT